MRGQAAVGAVLFVVGLIAGLATALYFAYIYQPAQPAPQAPQEASTVTVTTTETVTVARGPRFKALSLYRSTDDITLGGRVPTFSLSFNGVESAHKVVVSLYVEISKNNNSDGSAALLVLLNEELPMYGDFGMTQAVRDYLRQTDIGSILVPLVARSLVLVPEELGGPGNSGVRRLVFNGTLLRPGRNALTLLLMDDDGDVAVIRSVNITAFVPEGR